MADFAWEGKDLDEHAARELYLTIDNDGDLYRQQREPIHKNLAAKKARGVYNHALAVKLFGYLVENGAKKYYAENVEGKRVRGAFVQGVGRGWSEMFPPKLRAAVAEEFTDRFEDEYALGNYDNYIPKKYQKKEKSALRKRTRSSQTSLGGMRG